MDARRAGRLRGVGRDGVRFVYQSEITREKPACVLFLLDRSDRMNGVWGDGGQTMSEGAAAAINYTLMVMCLRSKRNPGVVHFYDAGVIGYGLRPVAGGEGVEPAFGGRLAGRLVSEWASTHPDSFPPIVINITAGAATDDPYDGATLREWAERLTGISTGDGRALLFNVQLCPDGEAEKLFPASDSGLAGASSELFRISSALPAPMVKAAGNKKLPVAAGARGFALTARPDALNAFLEIGSRTGITFAGPVLRE